jgi:hypothetical protein
MSDKTDMFTFRLRPDERRRIIALRGILEQELGHRVSLGDVVRAGIECLEAKYEKKTPDTRGA